MTGQKKYRSQPRLDLVLTAACGLVGGHQGRTRQRTSPGPSAHPGGRSASSRELRKESFWTPGALLSPRTRRGPLTRSHAPPCQRNRGTAHARLRGSGRWAEDARALAPFRYAPTRWRLAGPTVRLRPSPCAGLVPRGRACPTMDAVAAKMQQAQRLVRRVVPHVHPETPSFGARLLGSGRLWAEAPVRVAYVVGCAAVCCWVWQVWQPEDSSALSWILSSLLLLPALSWWALRASYLYQWGDRNPSYGWASQWYDLDGALDRVARHEAAAVPQLALTQLLLRGASRDLCGLDVVDVRRTVLPVVPQRGADPGPSPPQHRSGPSLVPSPVPYGGEYESLGTSSVVDLPRDQPTSAALSPAASTDAAPAAAVAARFDFPAGDPHTPVRVVVRARVVWADEATRAAVTLAVASALAAPPGEAPRRNHSRWSSVCLTGVPDPEYLTVVAGGWKATPGARPRGLRAVLLHPRVYLLCEALLVPWVYWALEALLTRQHEVVVERVLTWAGGDPQVAARDHVGEAA